MDQVRLSSSKLDFWVDVSIHNRESRWLAIAVISGEAAIGTGLSALAATQAALAELGPDAVGLLLEAWQGST